MFITRKVMGTKKTLGKIFGEISEIPKIRETFPRKFTGNFPENSQKPQGVF